MKNLCVVPDTVYNILAMQGKIDKCLFVYDFAYIENGVAKTDRFSFKIAGKKEFDMYVNYEAKVEQDKEIKRPKKPE